MIRRKVTIAAVMLAGLVLGAQVPAQENGKAPEMTPEQKAEMEAYTKAGTVTRTMTLDGRVLVEDFKGTMMGGPFNGHGMMGYATSPGNTGRPGWTTCPPA